MFFQFLSRQTPLKLFKSLVEAQGKRAMQSFLLSFFSMGLLFGVSEPAFAWFRICNHSSEDLLVAYAYRQHYLSSSERPAGWVSRGWWNIPRYYCKTIDSSRLTNRYSYVFSKIPGGPNVHTGDTPFCVMSNVFHITQYDEHEYITEFWETKAQGSHTCTGLGESARYESFEKVDTGTADNFILTLTTN